ncbi:ATP-dependent RecD-like DNA helicase, partial [Thermodesulfobacteriota bacterium]
MPVEMNGQIDRITFSNQENGFTIAKVKISGRRELVTIVGNLMAPSPGEILKMRGEWVVHPKYGEQFKVIEYAIAVPASVRGIKRYLGSGLIKGIGPVMAERIVGKFGKKTLTIIENEAERLAEVEGVGKKRIEMIKKAWDDQKEIRDVMLFLQSHEVSSTYATKIFKQYGYRSIAVVKANPYRLATDIFGIGFTTADRIAEKLGFRKDSPVRVEAGILYVLQSLSEQGHVFYPEDQLLHKCREILQVDRDIVAKALCRISENRQIVVDDLDENTQLLKTTSKAVYLARYHACEKSIATRMKTLLESPGILPSIECEKAVTWVQKRLFLALAQRQIEAVRSAFTNKVLIITGGPGTGKTTIVNAILKIYTRMGMNVLLAAPTGRAAKRMNEATGHDARTIHRLLEFSMQKGGFQRNEEKPLDCHLLIVDEASMIDTILMHHLLKAVPPEATFILVGDINQLPSVGAGNVLKDIIESKTVAIVELIEIFRQARKSRIIVNAHKINRGVVPTGESADSSDPDNDFYFIQQEDPEQVLKIILELVSERIPRRFGFDPVEQIQVLTPMHKGLIGAGNLNAELQRVLNPTDNRIVRGGIELRVQDKVMQVRNNYEKEVFNGDIGRVVQIYPDNHEVTVRFEGRDVGYDFKELDEIMLAYAISVHKSQGCEFPAVVMPMHTQHFMLLQRNLIYTAVTRGRKLVVMVGTRKALAIGISNNKTEKLIDIADQNESGFR